MACVSTEDRRTIALRSEDGESVRLVWVTHDSLVMWLTVMLNPSGKSAFIPF